jgi:hypothetical protein
MCRRRTGRKTISWNG